MTEATPDFLIKKIAREAVETFIRERKIIQADIDHPYLLKPAAAFVSLKVKDQLRGCLGTIEPRHKTLAEEIIQNAVKAATQDYRFSPVQLHELAHLEYSIDVLSKLIPIQSINELDAKKFGVLVQQGIAQGLLLPDLDGVETVEQQLDIAKQKADIFDNKGLKIFKFEVRRF